MGTPLRRLQHFYTLSVSTRIFSDFIGVRNPQNAASGAECTQFAVM